MKKNKFIPIVLVGCLLFSGCNGDEGKNPSSTTSSTGKYVTVTDDNGSVVTDEKGNPVTSLVPSQPVELELNVGFIYPGSIATSSTADYFEAARGEVERVLGAKTYYIENVLVSQFEAATAALVEKGCNIIVSTDARYANAVHDEAKANKKVQFVSFGGKDELGNLACYQGQLYKPAYVCGIAAAFNSDKNVLGVVADPSVSSVYSVIDGFVLGAKELTEKSTDVRVNWAWGSENGETKQAIDNLVEQGCDVIFTATPSKYAVQYCEQLGVKVVGMAFDTPELAPNNYITGAFCNLNIFLIDVLRSVRFATNPVTGYNAGIKEGAVRVVAISKNAKEGTKEIADKLYQLCSENKAPIFKGELKDTSGDIKVGKGETLNNEKILSVDWLESSVKSENYYCQPNESPAENELVIHESSSNVTSPDSTTTAADTTN